MVNIIFSPMAALQIFVIKSQKLQGLNYQECAEFLAYVARPEGKFLLCANKMLTIIPIIVNS
jgi:hypothetical protein